MPVTTAARVHLLDRQHRPAEDGEPAYWCPVCGHVHLIHVSGKYGAAPKWGWNKSMDKPTFTPSVMWYTTRPEHWYLQRPGKVGKARYYLEADALAAARAAGLGPEWTVEKREATEHTLCHVHVTDGVVHVLPDSKALGGQHVPLRLWVPVHHKTDDCDYWTAELAQ